MSQNENENEIKWVVCMKKEWKKIKFLCVVLFCWSVFAQENKEPLYMGPSFLLNIDPVMPEVQKPVSDARMKSALIYQRLTGTRVPIDYAVLSDMEQLILQNKTDQAASLATQDLNFYNLTVRDFAARMSSRAETYKAPVTDFIATVVGAVRDQIDARLLLTGNFYYKIKANSANGSAVQVPQNVVNDILLSNNHYNAIDEQGLSMADLLEKVEGQKVIGPQGVEVPHPDPAGLLTTRGWLEAHATAGTNRRLVEFSFREFMCINIDQWADTSNSDERVGRDVDRFPGGSSSKFLTTCKGCHSGMDSLRGAFAQVDFADDRVKHGQVLAAGNQVSQMKRSVSGVSDKLNGNAKVFPEGYVTVDSSWINQTVRGTNQKYFGWRGAVSGSGINAFGAMISRSQAFSRCMVQRVYSTICKRDVSIYENLMILALASEFEKNNYNLKWLFEHVVVRKECLGD